MKENKSNKKVIIGIVAAVLILVIALAVNGIRKMNSSQMEMLSQGQVEYYEKLFQRYELEISTEEFMEYCEEIEREQVNDERLVINYECKLDHFEEVLPACKELRYVSVSQEEGYPEMVRISFKAFDENEIVVSYADNMVWEWLVYDAQADELLSISEFKWVKYTNYKKNS